MRNPLGRLACVALLMSPAAHAAPGAAGFLDLFYVPKTEVETSPPPAPPANNEDDGDGYGIRGLLRSGDKLALAGEYQTVSYDDSATDLDRLRLGIGVVGPTTSGLFAEYQDWSNDAGGDLEGYAVRARFASPGRGVQFQGEIAWVMLENDSGDDIEGLEWLLGAHANLNPQLGVFVDYRVNKLEDEKSSDEDEFTDLRVGIRINL